MGVIAGVPHPFPYQGSKRQLASQILACLPPHTERLIEPFAGSAAVSIAAAYRKRARRFLLNDIHDPLVRLWKAILQESIQLADDYEQLWWEQRGQERTYYDRVRDEFNSSHAPHLFLYLLARCVKAAVRYNGNGAFNNSPDNRRLGMRPDTMRRNILQTSRLLGGMARLECRDYQEILAFATPRDVVYLDPPYQGVCATRDHRYCKAVSFDEFVAALNLLNRRQVPFFVSYDGQTGEKVHGQPLPARLELVRCQVRVGRSTQATLLGRKHDTIESLYLSPALLEHLGGVPDLLTQRSSPSLFSACLSRKIQRR